jgi:hypothetical protein
MTFEQFTQQIIDVLEYRLNKNEKKYEFETTIVRKMNQTKTAIQCKIVNSNIGLSLYPQDIIDCEKLNVDEMDKIPNEIIETIIKSIEERVNQIPSCNINNFADVITDFNKAEEHILPYIISINNNQNLLNTVPYTMLIDDLAIIYKIRFDVNMNGEECSMESLIDNQILKNYGKTIDELHATALENLKKPGYAQLFTMMEVIVNQKFYFEDVLQKNIPRDLLYLSNNILVVTNRYLDSGASVMLYKELMDHILKNLNAKELYIIPSSIHEVIVLPVYDDIDIKETQDEIKEMINNVNRKDIPPEEILSNNLYLYDGYLKSI